MMCSISPSILKCAPFEFAQMQWHVHFLTTSTQPSEDSKIILLTFLLAVLAIGILDNSKVDFRQFQRRAASINKFQSRSDRLVPQDNSKVDFWQFQRRAASQKNPKKIDWFHKTIPKSIFDNSSLQQRPKKNQSRSIGSTRPFQSRFSTIPTSSSVPKKSKVDRLVRQNSGISNTPLGPRISNLDFLDLKVQSKFSIIGPVFWGERAVNCRKMRTLDQVPEPHVPDPDEVVLWRPRDPSRVRDFTTGAAHIRQWHIRFRLRLLVHYAQKLHWITNSNRKLEDIH